VLYKKFYKARRNWTGGPVKTLVRAITVMAILVAICGPGIASEAGTYYASPNTDSSKFASRLAKKQQLLSDISQNMRNLTDLYKKHAAPITADMISTSDMRFPVRPEEKLGKLVNQSLDGVECTTELIAQPPALHLLQPNSCFDTLDLEKEMEKVRKE